MKSVCLSFDISAQTRLWQTAAEIMQSGFSRWGNGSVHLTELAASGLTQQVPVQFILQWDAYNMSSKGKC